jgi:ABC-type Fe3+-hydroxamate transport system substrate-binding protein
MYRNSLRLSRRAMLAVPLAALPRRAQAAASFPDALGRPITLPGPARRIVLGFNFVEFTAIAGPTGWDRVVGMSKKLWASWRAASFKRYLAPIPRLADMPDVGDTDDGSFSLEKVLALRPDLVVLAEWSWSALGAEVTRLESAGIPVMVIDYNAEIPARHVASTLALGHATGELERARALAELYMAKLRDIRQRTAGLARRPRAYIELGQGGPAVIGNTYWKSMWGRLLTLIGADNIAAGRIPGAWGPLNPEYVLAADPDAIFIAGSSWPGHPAAVVTGFDADIATTRARLRPYEQRPGWAGLKAIRDGQLFAIEHGLCRALFDYTAMQYLAKQLFPDRFTDIDPVAELRRYHERFLPVRFEGCWMARVAP